MTMHRLDVSPRLSAPMGEHPRLLPTTSHTLALDTTVCAWAIDLGVTAPSAGPETGLASRGFVDFDVIETVRTSGGASDRR
jgi:hypothetical protein